MKVRSQQKGFSIIELIIVIAIILAISAIAFPKVQGVMEGIQLRNMVTNVNGLVQQDRIQSVRDNTSYTIKTAAATAGNGITLYVDNNNDGAVSANEPTIQLPKNVTV